MDNEQVVGLVALLFMFAIFAVLFVVVIFFCITLMKTLKLAGPENRTMEPGMVFLNLIPIFSLVWIFITVLKISEAIGNKLKAHNVSDPDEGGKMLGLIYAGLAASSIILGFIPFLNILLYIGIVVLWIMYWVKIAGYNRQMATL